MYLKITYNLNASLKDEFLVKFKTLEEFQCWMKYDDVLDKISQTAN